MNTPTQAKHTPNTITLPFSPEALKLYEWIISDNDSEIARGDLLRTKEGREVFLLAKDIQLVLAESDAAKELAKLKITHDSLLEALQAIEQWLLPDLIEDTKACGDPKRLAQIEAYITKARAAIQSATSTPK